MEEEILYDLGCFETLEVGTFKVLGKEIRFPAILPPSLFYLDIYLPVPLSFLLHGKETSCTG